MTTQSISCPNLQTLDEEKVSRFHWKIIVTAGMGFFTDAYDLFVIGVVTAILTPIWQLSTSQLALLNGASLIAAAFGALFFGTLADKYGRKKLYGFEVMILFFGALLSASATSFTWLLLSRIVVGLGIGGDYPTSAVIVSEYSGRKNRGFLVLLVFAMQALGLMVGPLLATLLLSLHIPNDWTWRLLLGLGAIPAASVFYLRRTISETPRYFASKQLPLEVSRVVSDLTGHAEVIARKVFTKQKLYSRKWLTCLIGTAGAWFLLDVAFYGNSVSSVIIMQLLIPHQQLWQHTLLSALLFLCFAMPGYYLAAATVDKIGRKNLQMMGFFVMALCFTSIAVIPHIVHHLVWFMAIFGLSFFFTNFGPNTTTFLIPSEIFPTNIRAKGHGLSAAIGKVGAFVGAFAMPFVLNGYGIGLTMGMMATVSIAGILITHLVPEMSQMSLEETEEMEEV